MKNENKLSQLQAYINEIPAKNNFIEYDPADEIIFFWKESFITCCKYRDQAESEILEIKLSEAYPKFD